MGLEDAHWSVLGQLFLRVCVTNCWAAFPARWDVHCGLCLIVLGGPVWSFLSSHCPFRGRGLPTQALPEEAIWLIQNPTLHSSHPLQRELSWARALVLAPLGSRQHSYKKSPPYVTPGRSPAPLSATVSPALKEEMTCVF